MSRILIVDDEAKIREVIEKYAKFEGYETVAAENGLRAIELCRTKDFDLVIMDIMMPELDGFSALREIRKFSGVPVIMLSARGEEYDKINGFSIGADDYVVKPFSSKELMLRIEAILRRTQPASKQNEIYETNTLKIDFTAHKVSIAGQDITMSPKEYALLFYLCKNKGIALSREKLLSEVWGYDFFGDDRTLDTHIKLLRKSLQQYAGLISTVRGIGYRFED